MIIAFFFLLIPHPPSSTLFPYTTLFRSRSRREPRVGPVAASSRSSAPSFADDRRSEEHTSELQSRFDLVCRLLLEKKKIGRGPALRGHQQLRRDECRELPVQLIQLILRV